MSHQYGEEGYVPTVDSHSYDGGTLVLHTIDSRQETDLVSQTGEPLARVGELVSEEQQEVLALYERN
jgi:hypothetical protein